MAYRLAIGKEPTCICLLRLEKRQGASSSRRALLDELENIIPNFLARKRLGNVQGHFVLLGGASAAILVSTKSLDNTAEIKEAIHNAVNSLLPMNERKLNCEVFGFPSSSIKKKAVESDLPIPMLVFARTCADPTDSLVILQDKLPNDVIPFITYGSHDFVFFSKCANLDAAKSTVNQLGQILGEFTQTYTMLGVPSKRHRKAEREQAGTRVQFHTALKLSTSSASDRFMRAFWALVDGPKWIEFFEDIPRENIIGYCPGWMDMIVNFRSSCVSDALDLACKIGDINDVIDTVTWPSFILEPR
jgi:hypothetical protein